MPLQQGQVIQNRYRIAGLLGQGGFGAVYKAWDLNLKMAVALKENADASDYAQKQFTAEAQLLARLAHANLPRVTDYFFIPSQGQYLVMDLIDGEDLQAMLDRMKQPLAEFDALRWIGEVCDALSYLHAQSPQIIHRDVKPANIVINRAGRAMLVDFGIAKAYDPVLKTTIGARAITSGYSPPEQYSASGLTEVRSDIYALGATLYTLLTYRVPPDSLEILTGSTPPPAPVQSINTGISSQVSIAIQHAMQLDLSRRFAAVADFKAALTSPPTIRVPPRHPNRVGMLLLGGAGLVCLLLLCVGGLSLFGQGILASLSGGGTPTPLFTIAPPATAVALATPTSPGLPPVVLPTARSTAIGLPTAQSTAFVLPTVRGSPVGPISRQTPSSLPTARVTQSAGGATLSAVKFAPGVLASDDSAVDPLDTFPAGTNIIYATFTYSNLSPGTPYRTEWLKNGELQTDLQTKGAWKSAAAGNWWSSLTNPQGITPATWQYNFYVNDTLKSSGKATIETAPSGQPNFTSIVFGSAKDANDAPVNPTDPTDPKLDASIDSLWAFFDGVSVPKGTKFSVQWLLNGKVYADKSEYTWNLAPNENNYQSVHNTDGSPLTEGTYEIKVWIGTRLVKLAAVRLRAP